ncbi:MAG TPA: hypothetical protein QF373_08360 [Verrucomicrobiota bacterium]|nr:hypothetical protein [Verrucomicrobiota bacterium]
MKLNFSRWVAALHLIVFILVSNAIAQEKPFRPEPGKFPPLEKAHSYRGELTFVDHTNRRGSIRIQGNGRFRFTGPSPFAMLPYGMVRYHDAPADLRDIPLGTVMHVQAYLPPDPKISSVPVLPVDNRLKKLGNAGIGSAPAENHVLLLEDEPSHCRRHGLVWKLKEVTLNNQGGFITARRERKAGGGQAHEETLTFDAATRFWRGRERLNVQDLIAEKIWPTNGKQTLEDQTVLLGITWKPTPGGVFMQFHISDIWLNDAAMERATKTQTETHKAFIRSRWMPGWIDAVEYGKFGTATVTATLFGGMDNSLYADFKKGQRAMIASAENTLKHWASGTAGTSQMASKGILANIKKAKGNVPFGSSGTQISLKTDLVTEGFRPGRIVRIHPNSWPIVEVPRDEYLHDARTTHEDRFPTPDIFPKY